MRISQVKRQALDSLKGKWGLAVLLTFIILLINAVLPQIVIIGLSGGISNWAGGNNPSLSANIFQLIYSLALIPPSVSVYWFYLNLVRGNNPEIPEVFSVYKDSNLIFKLVGVSILQGIFVFLWSLLFIIPGIIKSLSYSQTFFLLKDHPEYTVNQAITESKIRMKGYKGKYFLLGLSFIGWGILSCITLGIGLLWLIPYTTASLAQFYNELIAPKD